jgi:hypothetical protein
VAAEAGVWALASAALASAAVVVGVAVLVAVGAELPVAGVVELPVAGVVELPVAVGAVVSVELVAEEPLGSVTGFETPVVDGLGSGVFVTAALPPLGAGAGLEDGCACNCISSAKKVVVVDCGPAAEDAAAPGDNDDCAALSSVQSSAPSWLPSMLLKVEVASPTLDPNAAPNSAGLRSPF